MQLFDTRPERPGFRLQRLEVFNWGTFDSSNGEVYRFEPEGRTALLVGHNGSGKSTLVDAITTLLVDTRSRAYNVAAGAKRSERSLKTYIKGAYDRTADESQTSVAQYLRPQANHLSAISAVFSDEQLGKSFTLLQVLFLKKSDDADDKVYAFANDIHDLADDLRGLSRSDEVRGHLNDAGYQTTKTYTEYLGWIKRRTNMRNKAVDMFGQTVAVKDIQSLNEFIRKHMLESPNWREKINRLLMHFNDLSTAHQELVRARQQIDLLQPVEKIGAKYRTLADERNHLSLQQAAAATFFQQQIIDIFQPEIDRQRAKLSEFEEAIGRLETQLSEQREKIRRLRNEIEEAGGKRLQQLPDLIRLEQERLERKQENFLRYEELCRNCQVHVQVLTSEQFRQIRPQIDQLKDSIEAELTRLKHQKEEEIGKRARLNDDLLREVQELQELEKRSSKLPPRFASMRSQICRALHLDESALPFAAELISVSPEESRWEASVEMVLRSFGLSLLIPLEFHSRVRGYVEGHRMEDQYGHGARIDYLCVGKAGASSGDRIHQKSLFHKLQFKQHSMTPWIKAQVLRRFDFQCCDSVDEFNRIPKNALTANRHVKINAELHKKDDRSQIVDPRHFVLGWDNTDKKRRIKSRIAELEVERDQQSELIQKWDCQLTAHAETQRAATELLAVTDFESINFQHHEREIDALQQELRELKESNETVKLLAQRLHAAEGVEQQLEQERTTSLTTKGSLTTQIQQDERLVASAVSAVTQAEKMGVYEEHASQFATIRIALGQPEPTAADFSTRKAEWEAETNRRLASLASSVDEVSGKLTAAMTRFLREFKEESDDLHASPQSLDSFLGVLDQLRREDLPRYERKFKERLNEEVTKEVALFNNALRQEEKEIADKITQLNIALANVDYDANRGTYMRLDPRRVNDKEIETFRRSLRECLDDSLDSSYEANQVRFHRIKTLVERLADKERATWRSKVTDVRNWFDFAALEMERDSKVVKSCYDGSSGQSGGEKAKLAFTILVAALAYQFDVDPSGETAGRFQFVVVDEMFSKVDDQNACYALRLFQQFGLQLLIVAPLDAKARVTEPFVDRYLHVVKDASTQRSQMFSMTAQEYDEVLQGFASNGKPRQARSQRDNESLRSSR